MSTGQSIIGLVLAGGRSSRFGANKAFAGLGGVSLLERSVARLGAQTAALAISANEKKAFEPYGLPVISDEIAGFAGPLAGVAAGLAWTRKHGPQATHMVTAAVDTPFFPDDLVARLLTAAPAGKLAMAASESGTHPAFALWPVGMEEALLRYLKDGGRKMHDWMARADAIVVTFPAHQMGARAIDPFFNVNRPEDLAAAEEMLHFASE